MKIVIIGYGNMGHQIEKIVESKGFELVSTIDPAQNAKFKQITKESLKDAEVCIDFTIPGSAIDNIRKIAKLRKNIVIGTTGWYDKLSEARKIVKSNNIGNGVNVVFHRDCLKTVGVFSIKYKYIGDYDYLMRLANKFDFVYISKFLTYYRVHDASVTANNIKQFDRYKEGEEIIQKNLLESEVISKSKTSKLLYFQDMNAFHRILYLGTRYKSGETIRFILDCIKQENRGWLYESHWKFLYFYSYFLNENIGKTQLSLFSFIGRLFLYPNKVYFNYHFDNLVNSICNDTSDNINTNN